MSFWDLDTLYQIPNLLRLKTLIKEETKKNPRAYDDYIDGFLSIYDKIRNYIENRTHEDNINLDDLELIYNFIQICNKNSEIRTIIIGFMNESKNGKKAKAAIDKYLIKKFFDLRNLEEILNKKKIEAQTAELGVKDEEVRVIMQSFNYLNEIILFLVHNNLVNNTSEDVIAFAILSKLKKIINLKPLSSEEMAEEEVYRLENAAKLADINSQLDEIYAEEDRVANLEYNAHRAEEEDTWRDVNDDDYSVPSEEQIKKTWDDVIQKNKTNENIDKLKNIRDDITTNWNTLNAGDLNKLMHEILEILTSFGWRKKDIDILRDKGYTWLDICKMAIASNGRPPHIKGGYISKKSKKFKKFKKSKKCKKCKKSKKSKKFKKSKIVKKTRKLKNY